MILSARKAPMLGDMEGRQSVRRYIVSVQCVHGWLAARELFSSKRLRLEDPGRATPAQNRIRGH
jgi:hypothetical protein